MQSLLQSRKRSVEAGEVLLATPMENWLFSCSFWGVVVSTEVLITHATLPSPCTAQNRPIWTPQYKMCIGHGDGPETGMTWRWKEWHNNTKSSESAIPPIMLTNNFSKTDHDITQRHKTAQNLINVFDKRWCPNCMQHKRGETVAY